MSDRFDTSGGATRSLWKRLAHAESAGPAAAAMLGLGNNTVDHIRTLALVGGHSTAELIEAMPSLRRKLKTTVVTHSERCYGDVRGPIQWAPTTAAQASTFGSTDVYVCASAKRSYDVDENRVLVAALRTIDAAGRDLEADLEGALDADLMERVVDVTDAARSHLEHDALKDVYLKGPVTRRALRRTQSGRRRRTYRPALEVLDHAREPVGAADVVALADETTREDHALFDAVLTELRRRGMGHNRVEVEGSLLTCGPVVFTHRRLHRGAARPAGVIMGSLVLAIPPLSVRQDRVAASAYLAGQAKGRPCLAVCCPADVKAAVDAAVVNARSSR